MLPIIFMEYTNNPHGISITKRYVSPGGEKELFTPYNTRHGNIELVDYMGGDDTVVRVATAGHGTSIFPEYPDTDDFIAHLNSSRMLAPFKSVQLKLKFMCPIRAAIPFVYDSAASVNEYSGRYSVMPETAGIPIIEQIIENVNDNSEASRLLDDIKGIREESLSAYQDLISMDFARELARTVLGPNNDTMFFWKNDLVSIARIVSEGRKKYHNNSIEREYIESLGEIASKVAPMSWDTLMNDDNIILSLTYPRDKDIVDSPLSSPGWAPKETIRETSLGLEEKLFVPIEVLDHGLIQAVDYMGNDSSPAQAARVSYGKGTRVLSDDVKLVKSLVRDAHTSPLEMIELAYEFRAPLFTDPRQIGRHRTLDMNGFMEAWPLGNNYYMPLESEMKYQDRINRQGRGKDMNSEDKDNTIRVLSDILDKQVSMTESLYDKGVPEDIIRDIKGVGFYTKGWRTGDALNLLRFFQLRSDPHAQYEVRKYSLALEEIMQSHIPHIYDAARCGKKLYDGCYAT